ncbi:MAG: hypothetical protein DDG60_17045 [Anaerolineae bacterium]|nr:MAG: hypothetical protein DDG60_17045 [Anaerolineae bacterium]
MNTMNIFRKNWRKLISVLPLLSIVWASFQPIQQREQQFLVLFTLLWFYIFILLEAFGSR